MSIRMASPRKPYQSMDMAHVIEYMKNSSYPPGFTEGEKRNLRKRTKSFALKGGQLYYTYKPKKFGSSTVKREDRLVLTEYEDQIKCIAAAHVDSQGNHLGREKVTNIVSQKYYWMGIPAMVREYSQTCQVCQAFQCNKSSILSSPYITVLGRPPQPKAEDLSTADTASIASSDCTTFTDSTDISDIKVLSDWPFGDNLEPISLCFWDVVEMSIFGPYESKTGSKFVVSFLDIFSCWVEAFVVELVLPTVITHFLLTLTTRFGAMKNFTLKDIGEFSTLACLPFSRMLKEMANLDITVHSQGSYNTGMQWKEVKDALDNFITNNTDWEQCLDFALLPLRISRGSKADYTPAYLAYGRELRLPSKLSHRNDMECNSASDPHLTRKQMRDTSDLLLGLYKNYKADLTTTELSTSDHVDPTPTAIKVEETTSFRVPEHPVRITRGTKRTYGELDTGKVDDTTELKERPKKTVVDKDYVDNTDETIINTRSSKTESLSKQRETISVETDRSKFNDTDGTTEHSYAGSPQEDIGIHKFYSAVCLYKKEQRYPPKSGEHFKRAIRQASKRYILNKDGLFLLVGGIPKKVPIQFEGRMALLKSAHIDEKGHHCTKSQMMQVLSKYTWRGIHLDCEAYSRACSGCNHGRDLSSVMRSTGKDEKVAEIAEENYDLLVQYLKKNKLPGKCSKEEESRVKKIAHLFKFENGQVFLKETKIAPARCLELTPRSRKAAIRKACTRLALPELDQEDLYREVIKLHIWNGMKEDIAKYVKDNGGHLSEDMGDSKPSQGASKNLKQIYSRVEEFKQYFKKKENKSRGCIKSTGKLENTLENKVTAEKTDTVSTVLSTEPHTRIENTEEKAKSILGKKKFTSPQPKKVYLVSTTRDNANKEGQDQAKIMVHIEEIDEQTEDKEGSRAEDKVSQGKKVGGPPKGVNKKPESVAGSGVPDNSHPIHQIVVSDSSQSCAPLTQTIASDPVTAAAVKSILDIGPETLNRASRVSPLPHSSQTNREGSVIMDLDTYKTIGGTKKGATQDNSLTDIQPVEEAREVTIEIVVDEAKTPQNETTIEVVTPVQVPADNAYEDKKLGNHAMFSCTLCNKMIRGVVKYKIHMYQHTGVKPFKCEVCNKVFTTPKSRKLHQRKHLGFSPYLCNICGKSFSLNGSLRAHIKIHEKGGNVVVHCKVCDRAFASRNRYERHMKFRHPANPPIHKCEECNKTFTTSRAQKRHHISHHLRVKCHLCGICGRQFYRKEYLTSHMLQHSLSNEDDPSLCKRRKSAVKKLVPVLKVDEMSEPEQLSPTLETAPVMEEVVMDSFDVPHVVSSSTTVQQVSYTEANVQVENTFYAIQTHDGDPDMEQTVVYGYPAVQYEVECSSAGELDSEALSAINLLAQASASQGAETVTYVSDGY